MPSSQRVATLPPSSGGDHDVAPSPQARRLESSRWRDPRLWVGVLLVLGSIVLGARAFASAADTTAVWQVRSDLAAGSQLTAADVAVTQVHFSGDAGADRYLSGQSPIPAGSSLAHDVAAGELLAVSALRPESTEVRQQLPLSVTPAGLPSGLAEADIVDVWAVPDADTGQGPAVVLSGVTVTAVSGSGPTGLGGDRAVTVAVGQDADIASALRRLSGSSVVLVLIGG